MVLNTLIDTINKSKHIIITAHQNPDGDAIGAMVGMGLFCASQHIPYTILLEAPVAQFEYLLKDVHTATVVVGEWDTMIALDCGNRERLVGYEPYFSQATTTIAMDHHITNDYYAQMNYIQTEASSTSELVYDLIVASGIAFTTDMARALYTGMLTDTGGFMHSCTGPSTLEACAKLITYDFDFSGLYHKLIHEKSLNTVKLQSVAVNHLKEIKEGIFLSYLTQENMDTLNATKEDVDGIVSFLKNIQGVQVIAFMYPLVAQNSYKLSTRSNPPYDVAAFCSQFGGGGHILAAGATLKTSLEDGKQQIADALLQLTTS